MTRVVCTIALLAATLNADVLRTAKDTFKGIVTMPDSNTISVSLDGGGMRIFAASDVALVSYDNQVRYNTFREPLSALGIMVEMASVPGRVQANVPSSTLQGPSVQISAYQSLKRDPAMAGLLSVLAPVLGHAYAKKTGTGVGFLIAEIAEAGGAYLLFRTAPKSSSVGELTALGVVLAVALPITKIWECGDAIRAADEYNEGVRQRLGLQVGMTQEASGIAGGMTFRF